MLLFLQDPHMQCLFGAGPDTIAAPDALHTVRRFRRVDTHPANLGAFAARHTFAAVKFGVKERKLIEEAIDGTKRAQIFAEGPPDDHAHQNDGQKHRKLPCEQPSQKRADTFIPKRQQNSGNRAGRADVLAEKRREGIKHGQHNHQDQNRVFEKAQQLISLEPVHFLRKGYLMNQFLQQAHRTKKATNCSSQHRSKKEYKPYHIIRNANGPGAQETLQGADWTSSYGTRAGVTMQPWNANRFTASLIDLSRKESHKVGVLQDKGQPLNKRTLLIQCQHTPDRFLLLWQVHSNAVRRICQPESAAQQ